MKDLGFIKELIFALLFVFVSSLMFWSIAGCTFAESNLLEGKSRESVEYFFGRDPVRIGNRSFWCSEMNGYSQIFMAHFVDGVLYGRVHHRMSMGLNCQESIKVWNDSLKDYDRFIKNYESR